MLQSFLNLGGWSWVLLGIALVALELLAPGLFLIWLGLAAIATGLIDIGLGLSWQVASLVFAFLSLAAVLGARRLTMRRGDVPDPAQDLNARGHRLVGQTFRLDRPLANGEGQLKVGDSVWRITGPDIPANEKCRVTGIDGATLSVVAD